LYIVIFRARIRHADDEYTRVAARLRELALNEFDCLGFQSMSDGPNELTLSYWPGEEAIQAWKSHPEHVLAQRAGRERWYDSYSVQVAVVTSEYRVDT